MSTSFFLLNSQNNLTKKHVQLMKTITIITGGHSGLGLEIAKIISMEGNVCVVGRDVGKLRISKEIISKEAKGDIVTYKADVSDENQVKDLFIHLSNYNICKVINCAGVGRFGAPENINTEMVIEQINSNLLSVIYMSANAINHMKDTGGTIVTILSTAALKGNPLESIYCATKWGAKGYCESLKTAYKGSNIKIITVCPGGINTGFWTDDCGLNPNTSKFMNPEELAQVICFNIADKNTLMCSEIVIDKI